MINKIPKILVVEDERPLAKIIQDKLSSVEYEFVSVINVKDALVALSENKIDLIWLDHYLIGEESGLDLVAEVKAKEEWKNIPIFVVSNTASQDKVQTYMKLGADKYYVKSEHTLEEIIKDVKESIE